MRLTETIARWFRLGYDAIDSQTQSRRQPSSLIKPEDAELSERKRRQIANLNFDLYRNFAVAAYAIRKHLDYVATFRPMVRHPDDAICDAFTRWLVGDESQSEGWIHRCDVTGRLDLFGLCRAWETARVLDNDVLINLVEHDDEIKIQTIEGNRIVTPTKANREERWVNGVLIDEWGKAIAFNVTDPATRTETILSAESARLFGYYFRPDQVRGVAPLTSALNVLRDLYRTLDYALVKAKIGAMFALATYSQTTPFSERSGDERVLQLDGNPIHVELAETDRMEVVESKSPSMELQAYARLCISIALKALDLPYSFFDEASTNFSGSRQSLLLYDQSCHSKREDHRRNLNWIVARAAAHAQASGRLVLPAGVDAARIAVRWLQAPLPWMNPAQEASANKMNLEAGLTSRQRITMQVMQEDWFAIADELAQEDAYLRAKGLRKDDATPQSAVDGSSDDDRRPSPTGKLPQPDGVGGRVPNVG